jgi:hypothetical protein
VMTLDLTDDETAPLVQLLRSRIADDRYRCCPNWR